MPSAARERYTTPNYAATLREWHRRFLVNRARIRQLYDERFCRMWELYLLGCEMQFRHLNLAVFQLHLAREVDGVPLTRDYQFAQETPSTAGAPVIKFGAPVRAP